MIKSTDGELLSSVFGPGKANDKSEERRNVVAGGAETPVRDYGKGKLEIRRPTNNGRLKLGAVK